MTCLPFLSRVKFNIWTDYWGAGHLAILKKLKQQYPDVEWFHIFMVNDPRMAECSYGIGTASLREGVIEIQGGLPSDADIKEWNAMIGKEQPYGLGSEETYVVDHPRMRVPTNADLQLAHDACRTRTEMDREYDARIDQLYDEGQRAEADKLQEWWFGMTTDKRDVHIAKRLEVSAAEMSATANMVSSYYLMHFNTRL